MKRMLIIGNGFDLDLGLNTRYSDFAKSPQWPFKEPTSALAKFLQSKSQTNNWFDLEQAIGDFSKQSERLSFDDSNLNDNKADFKQLVDSLSNYLKIEETGDIHINSTAARVLKAFLYDIHYYHPDDTIISFNYTDLKNVSRIICPHFSVSYSYVHGSLKENNIILGFGDSIDSREDCEFMRKSFNENYQPPSFLSSMLLADDIGFFGLSFGEIDYAYFDQFFNLIITLDPQTGNPLFKKTLTFFTYDEASRLNILHNINERTGNKISQLFRMHDVQFIRTSNPNDTSKTKKFIQARDIERAKEE